MLSMLKSSRLTRICLLYTSLLKGREQQDAVTGLERDLDRAHLLAHVLRHALDGAAPQVGEQLRTDVYKRQGQGTLGVRPVRKEEA